MKNKAAICWAVLAFAAVVVSARDLPAATGAGDGEPDLIRVQVRFQDERDNLELGCHALKGDNEVGDTLELTEDAGYALVFPVDIVGLEPDKWWCKFQWNGGGNKVETIEHLTIWNAGDGNVVLKADNVGVHFFNPETKEYKLAKGWEDSETRGRVESS